jgi:cytochrome c biogenesis protein CcmG/thiol:disulfide interchange protein DsbE
MLGSRFDRAIVLIVVALLGGAWVFMSREQVANPRDYAVTEAPIVGHLAPDFTLKTPLGRSISLTDFVDRSGDSGRPVVLNYWASWCGPCRVETPELQSASLKYGEQIAILGINQGETPKTISEFGVSYGLTYPLLVDEANEVNREYGITSLPTTVFIDRNGVVREVFIGILTKATMTERLDRLIAGSR